MALPKNLPKSAIKKMYKLKSMGYTQTDIANRMGVSRSTVRYHTDGYFKKLTKEHSAKRKKTGEEKERVRKHLNKRYKNDNDYRLRRIETAKAWNRKNPEKRRVINKNYWERNVDELRRKNREKNNETSRWCLIVISVIFGLLSFYVFFVIIILLLLM